MPDPALPGHDRPQVRGWDAPFPTVRAVPLQKDMLRDHDPGWGQVNHLAGPLRRATRQWGSAVRTGGQGMDHLLRGRHPGAAMALCAPLPGCRDARRCLLRLVTRHRPGLTPTGPVGVRVRGRGQGPDPLGEPDNGLPQLGDLLRLALGTTFPFLPGIALGQIEPDQVIAGGMKEIDHGGTIAILCLVGNPTPSTLNTYRVRPKAASRGRDGL